MLKITSQYSGENTSVEGTLTVDGVEHTFDCESSASDRGTHATVDGETHWWCGQYKDNKEMEIFVEGVFDGAYKHVLESGADTDEHWEIEFDGTKYVNLVVHKHEEDDDE